ncbi:PfkB family carbohydrate kinase [Bacillus solitudinis]|uniref:PfkB family carbohydrate kinase n=1 Tax=Bacillus solitudinis TaxID=2014074 RepID=UPI000C246FFF|nr:PfkB family carbohydrate kinase [Bacillus solitudinis]
MSKVLCLGEILIDFVPTRNGENLKDVGEFKKVAGGAPANVSAAIANLGGDAYFLGKVGDDAFGDYLTEVLCRKGVNKSYLLKTNKANTALAFVSLQDNGERDFMFYRQPSADMLLEKSDLKEEWFEDAAIFHFGSISLIDDPVREATIEAIKYAKSKNTIISFDPNIRMALWKDEKLAREQILGHLVDAHILKLSEEELFFLTLIKNEKEAVDSLMKEAIKLILITRGQEGCTYYTKNLSGSVKAICVKPVDTTGAGDAFVGGLLYKLAQELNEKKKIESIIENQGLLNEILAFANVCGALTTIKRGAISALPSIEEVSLHLEY